MLTLSSRKAREAHTRALSYFKVPGVIKSSFHAYKGGAQAQFFSDFDSVVTDPLRASDVVLLYCDVIEEIMRLKRVDGLVFIEKAAEKDDVVGGGTIGAIQLATDISRCVLLPFISVRSYKSLVAERIKLATSAERTKATELAEASLIMVTDHCTSGTEALEAADIVEAHGGHVTDLVVYTLWPQRFRWDEFRQRDIEVHPLVELPGELRKLGVGLEMPVAAQP